MIGARGDYPESGAASDDLAGLIHLSNGPIEHDAWPPSTEILPRRLKDLLASLAETGFLARQE